jgi:hypothetical protein
MKFLITYSYPADQFVPVVKAWGSLTPQERANVDNGAKTASIMRCCYGLCASTRPYPFARPGNHR